MSTMYMCGNKTYIISYTGVNVYSLFEARVHKAMLICYELIHVSLFALFSVTVHITIYVCTAHL